MSGRGGFIMPFDMENLNPTKRFFWGDDEQEWVDLHLVPSEVVEGFRAKAGIKQRVEYRTSPRTGRIQRIEFVDSGEDKVNQVLDDINDAAIVDWHLLDLRGALIPCTREVKLRLIKNSVQFAEWLRTKLEFLRGEEAGQVQELEKN